MFGRLLDNKTWNLPNLVPERYFIVSVTNYGLAMCQDGCANNLNNFVLRKIQLSPIYIISKAVVCQLSFKGNAKPR